MAQPLEHRQRTSWGTGRLLGLSAIMALTAGACIGKIGPNGADTGGSGGSASTSSSTGGEYVEQFPYEPVSARIYVAKVKNLMIGEAATEEEIQKVEKDPGALRGLVHDWFVTPKAQDKLFGFFQKAFQQTQLTINDFVDQGVVANFQDTTVINGAREMLARTVLDDFKLKLPFTNSVTTHEFMMTPALMAFYLYIDQTLVDDANKITPNIPLPNGSISSTFDAWGTYVDPMVGPPITLDQVLDPNSPNYLHFPVATQFACAIPVVDGTGHVTLDANGKVITTSMPYSVRHYKNKTSAAFALLFGNAPMGGESAEYPPGPAIPMDVPPADAGKYKINCDGGQNFKPSLLIADDSTSWRRVKIRAPKPGEALTPFYDLKTLRKASEIVARMPRVGFFTTPAFFANWQTNKSNQARDVMNQTLVVALGKSINPVDKGTTTVLDMGDGNHSDPTGPCYGCHQTMDPMRLIFRKNYSYNYHSQEKPQSFSAPNFDFLGEQSPLASLDDLAQTLIKHPNFPTAWVQKLCFYANSDACSEDDPEFIRISKAFVDSKFDFQTLVSDLFSSPIITGAEKTKTRTDLGETVSVARQDHLCASLTNRLKRTANICASIADATKAQAVRNNIPLDGYLRGAEAPALSTDPTMFFRGAAETVCRIAADLTIDKTPMDLYNSAKKDQAITDFVGNIMGLASGDPTTADATKILQDHFEAAVAKGATPTQALTSTFVLACTSPTSLAIGL